MTEEDVGALCDEAAERLGYVVERYEQKRPSKICKGLPDRRYVIPGRSVIWVELKAPGGQLTEAQYQWLSNTLTGGGLAVVIDSVHVLGPILRECVRGTASASLTLRRRLAELNDLTASLGWRKER